MVNNASKWERKKLDQVMLDITNGTTQNQIDNPTAYPVTRIETISDGVIDLTRVKYLEEMNKNDLIKYRLKKGDILFSHINSIGHIGKTAYYDGIPETLIHGMNLLKLRPNSDVILPKYIFTITNYELFRNRVKSLAKKAINQASINQQEVGSIYLDVPPLVEQCGIVEVLGTVDECIRMTDAVIERAEELKRCLMQQLLTRGIGHTEYNETPLGKIPKTWKIRKIRNICKLRKNKKDLPNEIAHIPMEKIPVKDIFAEYEMVKKEKIKSGVYCEQGDILIAKITPSFENGKQAIVPVIPSICAIATTEIIPLIVKENINPYFIFYYLKQKHIRDIITSKMEGSTGRQRVPTDILLNHVMAVPPVDEQNKISQIFLTIEEKIKSESYKKNHLLEIKQGLMQSLLSGKIRVELKGDGLHRIGDGREANN